MIEAEEAIRQISEQIQAKEGRLTYLNDNVKYSTINVMLYQMVEYKPEPTVYEKGFLDKVLEGFENGWELVVSVTIGLINIWPFILISVLIFWKWHWIKSRFKKK